VAFLKMCAPLGITQAVTSSHNPKGNADTARLRRTLQAERLWLRESTRPGERERALAAWIEWDHTRYVHAALGDRTPGQGEHAHQPSHSTQFVVA
jgi:transposase InsO family protein